MATSKLGHSRGRVYSSQSSGPSQKVIRLFPDEKHSDDFRSFETDLKNQLLWFSLPIADSGTAEADGSLARSRGRSASERLRARTQARSDAGLPNEGKGTNSRAMSDELTDAKIAAAEARTDAKFAELRGDFSREFAEIKTALAHMPSTLTIWGASFTVAVSVIGILLAVIAFGGDRFDAGIGMSDVKQEQADKDKRQDEAVANINEKLDRLIAAQGSAKPEDK